MPANLHVSLVDPPARRLRTTPLPAQPLFDLRRVLLNPTVDRGVVDAHAALAHDLLKITVADDPDVFYNNYKFAASVACRLAGTNPNFWYLSDSSANSWTQTQYPCSATSTTAGQSVAANTWHHLQLYVNYSVGSTGGSYAYETFVWDG